MKPVVIFYYLPTSAYAHNVLLGALEAFDLDRRVDIHLPRNLTDLHRVLHSSVVDSRQVAVFWSFFSASFGLAQQDLKQTLERFSGYGIQHIAGGVHASAEPQQTLISGFDFVATGEGEETIVEVVKRLVDGRSIGDVPGLSWLDGGSMISSRPAARIELDEYPPFAIRNRRFNPIEITRGCIYACKFCQTPFMFKARFRHRSVSNVVHYVREMTALGMKDVRFITPTSLSYGSTDESVDLAQVEHLLSSVRQTLGRSGKIFFGSFPSEIRPEHASPQAFSILRKYVNNDNIIIGAQSGSDRVLSDAKRGHNSEIIIQAVRYAIDGGFTPNVDFLFGLPGETERDARDSIMLAEKLTELGANIHSHTFMPLPGTPYKDEEPGRISTATKRELERLTSKGRLYGKWRQQIGIAERMAEQQANAKQVRKNIVSRRGS